MTQRWLLVSGPVGLDQGRRLMAPNGLLSACWPSVPSAESAADFKVGDWLIVLAPGAVRESARTFVCVEVPLP